MTAARRRDGPLVFHLIPHTHWDREWYLGAAAFGARLVPLLDTLLDRLSRDPAYRTFLLDGQTVLLTDYLAVRPEQEPVVRRLAEGGRLQIGPWHVLADLLIPSAESLVRNLLLGAGDAERWGGPERRGYLEALYAPDMFGHPAALPMIAREFGLVRGALWRGLHTGRAGGLDLVRWSAPDGRDLLLYHLPRAGYEVGAALPADRDALAASWPRLRDELVARAATPHVAVFVGADHHVAHAGLPALRDALAALEQGSDVRISRLDDYLREAERHEPQLVTLEPGELRDSYGYTWTLQGVHATRAPQKRRNSELELLLERGAEPLAALARLAGGSDEQPLLSHTWRRLVTCQFHDSIAGTVSDEVARAVDARFDAVGGAAQEVVRRALYTLAGHDADEARSDPESTEPTLLLWNPAVRPRGGIVVADLTIFRRHIPVGPPAPTPAATPPSRRVAAPPSRRPPEPPSLQSPDGTVIPYQILDRSIRLERTDAPAHYPDLDEVEQLRVAFEAPEMSGLGVARLPVTTGCAKPARRALQRTGRTLTNRFVEVTVEPQGSLTVIDRLSGERYAGLLAWQGEDDVGDTYTACPTPDGGLSHPAGAARVRDLADGPHVAALEVRTALVTGRAAVGHGSGWADIRTVIMLFADDPVVRVRVELVNAARDHRLRLRFPTGLPGRPALAGAAFGIAHRGPAADVGSRAAMETPVRTAPAHRFAAAAEGARGLALFAPGFFEYEWTEEGDLLFSALRATGMLSRDDLPTRPGHAGWTTATPEAQCLGEQRFDLAFAPAGAAALERPDELLAMWEDCFLPIRPLWLRMASLGATPTPAGTTMTVELEGAGLVVSAVKPPERGSGVVLRCCNLLNRPATGVWRLGWDLKRARRVRADEHDPEEIALEADRRTVRFTVPAHGIGTFIVE